MDGQEIQHLFLHTIHVCLSFHQACEIVLKEELYQMASQFSNLIRSYHQKSMGKPLKVKEIEGLGAQECWAKNNCRSQNLCYQQSCSEFPSVFGGHILNHTFPQPSYVISFLKQVLNLHQGMFHFLSRFFCSIGGSSIFCRS